MKITFLSIFFLLISSISQAQVPSYVPTSGLLAYYPFNSSVNNAYTISDNGVIYGGVTFGTDRFGSPNSCYVGNGASGVDIPSCNFPIGNATRSASAWFKNVLPYAGGIMQMIAWGDNSFPGSRFGLMVNSAGVWFESTGTGVEFVCPIDSAWHHFVVTYPTTGTGTSAIKLYVDGLQVAPTSIVNPLTSLNTASTPIHCIGALFIPIYGYSSPWGYSWIGSLDDIGVWDRELTACEVWQIYSGSAISGGGITGPVSVCTGNTITLSDTTSGGIWISGSPAIATIISSTGAITGVAAGTSVITYSSAPVASGGCLATTTITVDPSPAVFTGPSAVCTGSSVILSDSPSGGTWSSSNVGAATITPGPVGGGIVYGTRIGTAIITYTLPTGCFNTGTITVNPPPSMIAGPRSVCSGLSITLTDAVAGGTWASGSPGTAIINSGNGTVTGVTAGTTTITYTTGPGCFATTTVTVDPAPATIAGTASVCIGSSAILSDAPAGGAWSSSNSFVATVTPGPAAGGTVYGVLSGTAIITYTLLNGCFNTGSITVTPPPSAIVGPVNVCMGLVITLSDAIIGGTWSSSSPGIATINSGSGIASGLATGVANITYTTAPGCFTTTTITVDLGPTAIAGPLNVCTGSSIILSDDPSGGTWSSGNPAAATITSGPVGGGIVYSVAAGTTIVTYTLPGGCFNTAVVTVNISPSPIIGNMPICTGAEVRLSDAVNSGLWSSGSPSVFTITPATGIVTGVTSGNAIVTYAISGCIVTESISVLETPIVILDSSVAICNGAQTTLASPEPPGVSYLWSTGSTDSSIIVSRIGIYTLIVTKNGCSDTGTVSVRNSLPAYPVFLGNDTTLCVGEELILHSEQTNAIWNNSLIAEDFTVKEAGTYFVIIPNPCGTVSDTINVKFENCDLTVPTGFTPNGDGLNDIFRAIGTLNLITDFSFSIYNRWGQRIFNSTSVYEGWDGKFHGVPQDTNTYFYMIQYKFVPGKAHVLKGDFQLIR